MAVDAVRAKSLFLAASDLADPAERAAYLGRECSGDAELRGRVEALLQANDAAPLPPDATSAHAADRRPPTEDYGDPTACVGTIIAGRYKLLEEIGEGGMGAVWVAEQTQPVRRKVALKLIKVGMDSKSVLARFEAERQALAVMDHPNIAKVLDGGLTDTGRPFFVMEYIKGVPITEYCDAARLSVPERLHLFLQVCQAVQHAHQKGIIHRDLKPSNILVAPYDDKPVPKVIDFGLAKAMHQSLTERTLHTAHETVLGTPLYMSPEQAQLNNLDVDTRSDIYSLGVLLYELLTGTTPLEKQRFKEAAWDEIKRLIREEEPPRPSTRLSSSTMLPSLAAGRQMEPARLMKLVRGELDWIVMKSLEKDRARRYETANGFAMDVQRYLAGEPVLAAPPSARYRLGKFARKHRAGLTTAAAIALLLVAGVAVSAWQAVRATNAERDALLAREQETQQRKQMQNERNRAVEQEAVAQANEQRARDEEKKVRTLIIEMMGLLQVFQQQVADVTAGYRDRGKLDEAVNFYAQASADLKTRLGPEHHSTYVSEMNLAVAYLAAGKRDQAIALFEKALQVVKAGPGPNHTITLSMMSILAEIYNDAGKPEQAIPLFEQTLPHWKATLGADDPYVLTTMNNLGVAYRDAGKLDQAIALLKETLDARLAKHGPNHPFTLIAQKNLALAYRRAGKFDLAIPLFVQTLEVRKITLGPDNLATLVSMNDLASGYQAARKLDLALPLFEETLKLRKAKLGPEHPDTLQSMNNLGKAYCDANQGEKAAATLKEFVAGQRKRSKPDNPQFAGLLAQVSLDLLKCRQHAAAEELLRECLAIREKKEPDVWTTFNTKSLLGGALLGQKKYADAEPLLLAGYEGMKQREKTIPPQGQIRLMEAVERLVQLYQATDIKDKAAKWRKELEATKAAQKKTEKQP